MTHKDLHAGPETVYIKLILCEFGPLVLRFLRKIQKILGLSPSRTRSIYLHIFTSATRLVHQRPSGYPMCLKFHWTWAFNTGWSWNHWASMAPNYSEIRGISPVSGSNSRWSWNHWASMAPNHSESRGIFQVPGSNSGWSWNHCVSVGITLDLNGTQLQWE
jgi:hypothetical protein